MRVINLHHPKTNKTDVAFALNITPRSLNNKISGKCEFKASEIKTIVDKYHLTFIELQNIFL